MHQGPRDMPREVSSPARALRVLLADDDDDVRALIAASLAAEGIEVVEAKDGGELLERLSHAMAEPGAQPDVVVTDVLMPRLSGLGVLDALQRARLRFPVILVTVLNDDSVHVVARRLGAVRVLRKPLDLGDLGPAIREASEWYARAAEWHGIGAGRA
jgi:CheY-like chemotaxis protein